MVLVCSTSNLQASLEYLADTSLLMHHTNTPIRKGFETTVQIEKIRQTVLVVEIDQVEEESRASVCV
jgi:GTPase